MVCCVLYQNSSVCVQCVRRARACILLLNYLGYYVTSN